MGAAASITGTAPLDYGKMLSGKDAETAQFGASTTSLILRSTAVLVTFAASAINSVVAWNPA